MDREKFLKVVSKRLDDIESAHGVKDNVRVEKIILFILDTLSKRTFRGIIKLKILDNRIFDPRIEDLQICVEREYQYLDE